MKFFHSIIANSVTKRRIKGQRQRAQKEKRDYIFTLDKQKYANLEDRSCYKPNVSIAQNATNQKLLSFTWTNSGAKKRKL